MNRFYIEKTFPLNLVLMNSSVPMITPRYYELTYTLETEEETGDLDKISAAHSTSFEILDFFINDILNNSVVIDLELIEVSDEFVSQYFENNIMVVPGMGEGTLIACLHSKFNTIIDKLSSVHSVGISDPNMRLKQVLVLEEDYVSILPEQEEWLGEYPFWNTPWWEDNSTRTYDNYNETKKDQTTWARKKKKEDIDAMLASPLEIIRGQVANDYTSEKDGEVIEVEFEAKKKWEPTVV